MSQDTREFVVALEGFLESYHKEQRGLFRDHGVTPVQYFSLRMLVRDANANMSSLAATLGVRPQTVTAIVDSLEESGWVRRERSTADRREALLRLTPKGQRLLDSMRAAVIDELGAALGDASGTSLRAATAALRAGAVRLAGEARPEVPLPARVRPR